MTDILVRWLNDELSLSTVVDQQNFARHFSTGYLIGEVLDKFQLQNDFDQFSQNKTADSKLNNFTRVEPVLHLLGIPFDTNLARDIMTERHGVATRVMYQLYIALNNKKKSNLTGVAMETMRPAAPAKLNAVETEIYKERLKQLTPRQTDLNLDALVSKFHQRQIEMEKTAFRERFFEQERLLHQQQMQRQSLLERSKYLREKQSEMVAKIQAATVHIPIPPNKTDKALQKRRRDLKQREATNAMENISKFEEKMKTMLIPSKSDEDFTESMDFSAVVTKEEEDEKQRQLLRQIQLSSNSEYIGKIKRRLQEDSAAREEREKRRRKVLVDQMLAHENQEEAHREEMMVNRLMRQSQQERRIAVQLLQVRREKEIICRNRILREKQYEKRRLQDFEDALDREAQMAHLAKDQYLEQTLKDQQLHDEIAAQRAEAQYKKHYDMCFAIVNEMVNFSGNVAEYRELTNFRLPAKLVREWTCLFINGMPLYEQVLINVSEPTPEQILEEERQQLLDEEDFLEYKTMMGEWQPPESTEMTGPPPDNVVVGHIIQRLFNLVHPPTPPPSPPEFPSFPIRACILGKVFGGKSTIGSMLAAAHRLEVLLVDGLVDEAVEAYKNGEVMEPEPVIEEEQMQLDASGTPVPVSPQPTTRDSSESTPVQTDTDLNVGAEDTTAAGQPSPAADDAREANKEEPAGTVPPTALSSEAAKLVPSTDTPKASPSTEGVKVTQSNELVKVPSRKSTKLKEITPPKPQPTPRAKLGMRAFKNLKRGKSVDDQIMVDILVEAIRRIPEGTGWVVDGFPQTYNQAKLLEKALSGYDAGEKESKKTAKRGSVLVPDPRPPPPPPDPISGIDVVIYFEIPDELCLKRAAGRYCAIQEEESYHQEFKPPPEGSATGIGKQEMVVPVEDPSHDMEQIQHRLTGFHDTWPKLKKWFTRFGTLKTIDATEDSQIVFLEVDAILEDTVNRLQQKEEESSIPVETEPVPEEPEKVPTPEPPKEEVPAEQKTSRPSSRTGSRGGSGKKSGSRGSSKDAKKERHKSESPKRRKSESPKHEAAHKKGSDGGKKSSRGSSAKTPKRGRSPKKDKTPEPEPEPEPEVPAGPPPPKPGDEEWEFVDQPLENELGEVLLNYWENVEKTYINNFKNVFRFIRNERENIYRYFYQIRKDFLEFLRRPDHKQEFVTRWQTNYNNVADDMRDDDETKADLHQRVDDVRETLWSICDERKEQAEAERMRVMTDGWLEDRLGILSNHYITVMQCEIDRFQDTIRLLKDYYRACEGLIPDELNENYARIPLIELPVERPESTEKVSESETTTPPPDEPPKSPKDRAKSPKDRAKSPKDRVKSPKSASGRRSKSPKERPKSGKDTPGKSRTPSGKRRPKSQEKPSDTVAGGDGDKQRKKIPLVPRRPISPDPDAKTGAAAGKDKKDKKGLKKGLDDGGAMDSPVPPMDPDEKLLFDAAQFGYTGISHIMQAEIAAREAEEEAERQKELEREKEKANQSKGKKGKKGKSRSPSPKKGKAKEAEVEPTPPPTEELSEEEKLKKLIKEKIREEYFFAITQEDTAAKIRLELIKVLGMAILQDLKASGDEAFKDLNDWLGARFLKEMESIDQMSELMRHAIEAKERIKTELVLRQQDFLQDEDLAVLRTPTPPPSPEPTEAPMSDQFTVDQLMFLFKQFYSTAPTGVMSNRSFTETLENLVSVTYGMEQLPDMWMKITSHQIQEMANILASDSEYVDWRRFMLPLTAPMPTPTQAELLQSLENFKEMDQKATGYVTREQYDRMNLWFLSVAEAAEAEDAEEPEDPEDPIMDHPHRVYNRMTHLKQALFDIFGHLEKSPSVLDYVSMLMYFSAVPNSHQGFLRALSVASGTHMPRLDKPAIGVHPPVAPVTVSQDQLKSRADSTAPGTPEIEEKVLRSAVEPSMSAEEIPPEAVNAMVSLDALYRVLHHGESSHGDSHRFSALADPEETTSRERLTMVFHELGCENGQPVSYKVLIEHPLIQDIVVRCKTFKLLDIKGILMSCSQDTIDVHSTKTMD